MNVKQTPQKPQLSEDWIDHDALDIVRQLQKRGHTTYLVGGCVRDLLIGRQPKDYDISTTAGPREVKSAVRNSYIIGKRFRLVLAKREDRLYEISTFRREPTPEELNSEDTIGDNIFGTPEEDAKRRDFTINALFYDPKSKKVIDHVHGLDDLKEGVVRMIGDPLKRLEEDPIRILRGIRLSHMIRFSLEPTLRQGMTALAPLLPKTALPRRREELLKFLRLDDPALAFLTAHDLKVLQYVTPSLDPLFSNPEKAEELIEDLHSFQSLEFSTPTDLFSGLTFLFAKSYFNIDFSSPGYSLSDSNEKILDDFMRNELGMFNAEQAVFKKSLTLIQQLRKRNDFERRGERRKWALFRNESFELALKLSQKFYLLNPSDLEYWITEYENRPKENIEYSRGRRKRRRRRRHPTDQRTQANANSDKS